MFLFNYLYLSDITKLIHCLRLALLDKCFGLNCIFLVRYALDFDKKNHTVETSSRHCMFLFPLFGIIFFILYWFELINSSSLRFLKITFVASCLRSDLITTSYLGLLISKQSIVIYASWLRTQLNQLITSNNKMILVSSKSKLCD